MGNVNLYKINSKKIEMLISTLLETYDEADKRIVKQNDAGKYEFSFFIAKDIRCRNVEWKWLADEFGVEVPKVPAIPKAVLLISTSKGDIFAATYGHSYPLVDKYSEKDFGLSFAKKLQFEDIKTTAVVSPGMKRNKAINSYINYAELDAESGESYAKIKVKISDDKITNLIKPTIEIGSSISFTTEKDSLDSLVEVIEYILDEMEGEDIVDIPMFKQIKDEKRIEYLDNILENDLAKDNMLIDISEIDIIGTKEVFNSNSLEYKLTFQRKTRRSMNLTRQDLLDFCHANGFNTSTDLLNIKVSLFDMDDKTRTVTVKEIIDYVVENEKCVLYQGKWYEYNDDYIKHLDKSLDRIDVFYNPEMDFSNTKHENYIQTNVEHEGADVDIDNLKKTYYAERVFNEMMVAKGYVNYDRVNQRVEGYTVEPMDLYKDGCMYAVKMGSTSSKLCYTVDQSLNSLRLYDNGKLKLLEEEKISHVALWFVLDKNQHIEDSDGKPDLKKLNLLILKNSIDAWSKTVRMLGYTPVIYINYRS